MIDLHLHFDGSLLARTVLELAKEQGIALPSEEPDELKLFLAAPADCGSLNEYLEKFDLPLLVLQTREAIRKGMYTLVSSLKEQGMLYAEIRFAPQLHTKKGLTQEQVVKAALQGLQEAAAGSFFKAKLILCCMRGADNREENLLTVRTAAAFLGRGVAALDLAGAEALYPTADYGEVFALAKELSVPFTIHAGEADGPESIRAALRMGASRIGHGVRAGEDPELLEEIEAQFLEDLMGAINISADSIRSVSGLLSLILGKVRENSDMCTLIFSEHGDRTFLRSILLFALPNAVANWADMLLLDEKDARTLFFFISGGAVSVIEEWVRDGFAESDAQIVRKLDSMIMHAQQAFIKPRQEYGVSPMMGSMLQ